MKVFFYDGVTAIEAEEDMDRIKYSDLGIDTNFSENYDTGMVDLINPTVYLPSDNSVGNFVGGLSTSTGNSQQTQEQVDSFIDSLQQPQYQPSPGPEPDPEPNPDPNPNPDPDIGGVSLQILTQTLTLMQGVILMRERVAVEQKRIPTLQAFWQI